MQRIKLILVRLSLFGYGWGAGTWVSTWNTSREGLTGAEAFCYNRQNGRLITG